MTEPAVGACVWASGSHVCTGNSGIFTAKAAVKPRKSHRPVAEPKVWSRVRRMRSNVKAWSGALRWWRNTSASMATSRNAEPSRV